MAVAAQVAAVGLQGLTPHGIVALAGGFELVGIAAAMTATVAVAAVLVWKTLRPSPAGPVIGFAFVLVGGITAYAVPMSVALDFLVHDSLIDWTENPALPVWEGVMTAVLGGTLVLRWLVLRRRREADAQPGS